METKAAEVVALPTPQTTGGSPLMDVFGRRHSSREFAERELPEQQLSNLLWAAFGVNRPKTGGRTAPSARNWREIDIYLAMKDGLFRYDPLAYGLERILSEDIRPATGMQDFVGKVPLNLIYVADLSRVVDVQDSQERRFYCAVNAGFIAQNVYLYCASEGLATVARGLINRRNLVKRMRLGHNQRVLLAQSVGYPA